MKIFRMTEKTRFPRIMLPTVAGLTLAICGGCRFVDSYWRVHPESVVGGPSAFPMNDWGGYQPPQWRKWSEWGPQSATPGVIGVPTLRTPEPFVIPEPRTPVRNGGANVDTMGIGAPNATLPPPAGSTDPATGDFTGGSNPTTNTTGAGTMGNGSRTVITSPTAGTDRSTGITGSAVPPTVVPDPGATKTTAEQERDAALQNAAREFQEEVDAIEMMRRRQEELIQPGTERERTGTRTGAEKTTPGLPLGIGLPSVVPGGVNPTSHLPTTSSGATLPEFLPEKPEEKPEENQPTFPMPTTQISPITNTALNAPVRNTSEWPTEPLFPTPSATSIAGNATPEELPIISVQFSQHGEPAREVMELPIFGSTSVPATSVASVAPVMPPAITHTPTMLPASAAAPVVPVSAVLTPSAVAVPVVDQLPDGFPTTIEVGPLRPYSGKNNVRVPENWKNASWNPYAPVPQRELLENCN